MILPYFDRFRPLLATLPIRERYGRTDLLVPGLQIDQEKRLRVFYCPFDWENRAARVIILGITPGFTQMELAYRGAVPAIANGQTKAEVCIAAKMHGSFAGSMRINLTCMLDEIGLPEQLGIESTTQLFEAPRAMLHTASAIRYPVFRGEDNYTGQNPRIIRSPMLMKLAREVLVPELNSIPGAVIVPCGKSVEELLQRLTDERLIESRRWLRGFPHPSGANGHRKRVFAENRADLQHQLQVAFQ
jgi:hypothetical protein